MSLLCRLTFGFLVPFILNFLIVSAAPNPSGISPQAQTTYYYAHVPYYTSVAEYYKINCDSWGNNCRTALRYKLVYTSKTVLKSRTTYVCPYGYQIIGNLTCHYIDNVEPQPTRPADKTTNEKTIATIAGSILSGIASVIFFCCCLWCFCSAD